MACTCEFWVNAASSKQQLAGHELELASFTQELNLYAANGKKYFWVHMSGEVNAQSNWDSSLVILFGSNAMVIRLYSVERCWFVFRGVC